jgi:hypothetical protein
MVFRHLEEHQTAIKFEIASARFKAEECFRTEPCERIVLEKQLCPRLNAGRYAQVILD